MNACSNYDDVLNQLRAAGLVVDSLEVGRIRRCQVDGDREKRGWYSLHELRTESGDTLLVGSYGIWRGAEHSPLKITLGRRKLNTDESAALRARIAEDRKRAERSRLNAARRAAEQASRAWQAYATEGESEYLTRKGVGPHGIRFTPAGTVVIPLLDGGAQIHGLQLIYPTDHPKRKKTGRDKDFWPAGLAKQGHFFLIGAPQALCLVAEGYATAASLYEATGTPVAVAFDAGNLRPVAVALKKRYPNCRFLFCADDDYLTDGNPGIAKASAAALAVGGEWVAPVFAADRAGKKITDFNDLHLTEGLHVVRSQIEARVTALGWRNVALRPQGDAQGGGGETDLVAIDSVDHLQSRFALVYEMADTVFDSQEHKLVPLSSMRNACTSRMLHRAWMESRDKRIVRVREVGFDPSEKNPDIKCNLWGGWPSRPQSGCCERLIELLQYLCSGDDNPGHLADWVLKWLAYPIQHPGAKMKTALVMHGPQGTGKNLFFEAVMAIYGEYGRIVDQAAVEDKFNDWASRKLFLIADEVVARMELYHTKNKLKIFVTGTTIRINPKNVGAYEEENHVNLVFLSNETQPLVLERDDRRYTVIWTPEKLSADFYREVRQEIEAGGIAALHDHLLNLPLGDFEPHTKPPMTKAKSELIELSLDSSERFWNEWIGKRLLLPVVTCRSEDLYDAYRFWAGKQGVARPAQLSTFVGHVGHRPGASKDRKWHFRGQDSPDRQQSQLIYPPGADLMATARDLTDTIFQFAASLDAWKNGKAWLGAVA